MPVTTFLAGGGEAGALVRSFDWSRTTLGDPQRWPEALRTALAVCLNSAIPSAVYWGPDLITLYNDAWAQQQAGRHPWAMGRPARESRGEIWETIRPQFEQVLAAGRGFSTSNQRLTIRRGESTESWWSYSIVPLHSDGLVGGLLTQGFDTTAQVRAEQLNTRQIDRLQEMFRQAPGAMAVLRGKDHIYEIANAAYRDLVGQKRSILGKPMAKALPELVEQGVLDLVDTVYRTGQPFVGRGVPVSINRSDDGAPETRMLDFVCQPILDESGEVADIFVEATDVTERLQAEAALAESESRFRGITNSIEQMIWSTRPDGRYDFYNDRWYEFTGVPYGSLEGEAWEGLIHPEDHERAQAAWLQSLATGNPYQFEYRLRHRSGAYRWVLARAQAVCGPDGEIARWFGTSTDIEDIVEAREVLSRSREELERAVAERTAKLMHAEQQLRQAQKVEAIGQLTGGIAHDFNNMLAVIMGGLNLLNRKLARGETDVQHYIEGAMEGARRAASLTSRLLAFARQQQLAPELIDANELVQGMTDLLNRTLGGAIRVETFLSAGLWRTFVDVNQLESAILNLAVNARDAMEGGGRLTIETANAHIDDIYAAECAIAAGPYVLIAVTDTGAGMAPDVMAKAFDPFFTTKQVGKGTGLGLSQVLGFIRQSGGQVKLSSEVGVGTTVKIYLPRSRRQSDASDRRTTLEIAASGGDEVVLVVEDEERVRLYSCETLRELGYKVVEARSAIAALQLIEAGHPVSLLFTDMVMPDMDGRRLADLALALRPDLKVLFTTGYMRNAEVHTGVLGPGTTFVAKPFTIDELARKTRQALDS